MNLRRYIAPLASADLQSVHLLIELLNQNNKDIETEKRETSSVVLGSSPLRGRLPYLGMTVVSYLYQVHGLQIRASGAIRE